MTADMHGREDADQRPDEQATQAVVEPARAQVTLSGRSMLRRGAVRWALTGLVRITYRTWTRVAARVFPEGSLQARTAERIGIPLPDRLNMSWITPQLAVGGRIHSGDIGRLRKLGVTRVVDTRSEYRDDEAALAAHGIQLLYLPTPDTQPLSIEQLREGSKWITEQIAQGERVLVHCEHGVGRSVLLAASALVLGGLSADDAIKLVQQGRWQAAPNHRQMLRLQEFEHVVHAEANATEAS